MSFEGYHEFLCMKGHYSTCDVHDEDAPQVCPTCAQYFNEPNVEFQFMHTVDQTNGYDERWPSTCEAPKQDIGFDDYWTKDHYDNKYAVKIGRFAPIDDGIWTNVAEERRLEEERRKKMEERTRWAVAWWSEEDGDNMLVYRIDTDVLMKIRCALAMEVSKEHGAFFATESDAVAFLEKEGRNIVHTFPDDMLRMTGGVRVHRVFFDEGFQEPA